MKKKGSFACLALAAMMAAAAFTGCSKESADSSAEESSAGGDEIVSVKWIVPGDAQEGTEEVLKVVNEKLKDDGLSLDLQFEPFGSYNDKLNMMISSQEEFDLCFTTAGWLNLYLPNVSRGAFVDITEMIDTQAAGLKEAIPEFLFDQVKVDGKVYAVPNYQISYDSTGVQVKTEILEKYNFDLSTVKKYEDLEPLLQQLKENEPGFTPACWDMQTVDYNNDYIVVDKSANIKIGFKADDPEMKLMYLKDIEKEQMALENDWFNKGYIINKSLVTDDSADRKAGKFLSYVGSTIKPGGESERSAQTDGAAYTQVALTEPFVSGTVARNAMTAVSSSSKNPEAAVKLLGIVNTDKEIFNLLNFGIEGKDYTKNEDGKIVKSETATYFPTNGWTMGNQFNADLVEGQEDGVWEETDKINREAEVSPISGFSFDSTKVSNELAQLSSVSEEFKNLAYFDNWETRYDEYCTKMEAAGLDAYIAEMQAQLDTWRAENQ